MTRLARRASLLVAFYLLTSAATAYAVAKKALALARGMPLLALALLCVSDVWAQPAKLAPVAEGTGRAGDSPTKWALYVLPDAAPGENIIAIEGVIGTIGPGKVGIVSTVFVYFAGIEGRTLHLYRIESKDLKEQTRYPIFLPLAADNTAVLRVRPLYADRSFTLRLRLGADNLLTGALAK